jgi:hypothetical protein
MIPNYVIYLIMWKLICSIIITAMLFVGCSHQKGIRPNEMKNDNVLQIVSDTAKLTDTIASFFGHQLVLNDSALQQIEAIASNDDFLSVEGNVLKTGNVAWGINVSTNGITLISSIEPDDIQMAEVIRYLNKIYGKPYEEEDEGFDIKWSSSRDSHDIFSSGSSLVHLHRVHSEEEGTVLIFN